MLQCNYQHRARVNTSMKTTPLVHAFLFLVLLSGCGGFPNQTIIPTQVPTIRLPVDPTVTATSSATPPSVNASAPVWVANPVDQVVLRIDPLTNSIAATIPIEGEPSSATAGEGAVWVLDRKYNLVFRIDPQTNRVVTSIPLPPGNAASLATGAGSVWVGMTGKIDLTNQTPGQEYEIEAPGMVLQIDPKSNELLGQLPVQPVSQITVDGTALWVLSHGTIDTPLQVFDLNTRQGMAVPLRNGPEWLPAEAVAVGAESLWLFSTAYAKIFHAAPDGRIISAIPFVEKKPTGYAALLLADSGLWAATPWGTILHIDPASNHVLGQIELGIPLTSLTGGFQSVWALSQQTGTLFRIDAERNEVSATISTGNALLPTIVPTPTPRIIIWSPCADAPTSRLKVGEIAYVTKDPPIPNRIRKEPSRDSDTLGLIGPGGGMTIIDGPACANGWVWWKVKNAEYEGWTAEGDKETYWLIPLYH
jgi:DNA-binding beta-propeller fold protein YncE